MRTVLLSLAIVALISVGAGFVLKDFIGFWQGVVGATIIQFLAFYLPFTGTAPKNNQAADDAAESIKEIIDLQTIPINCPCGKNTFTAPIFFNIENEFTCEKCGSGFKVEPTYDVVLVTEPVNIENIFNKLKEQSDNKV
jgi:uncharacterized Zn-finger protein